MKKILLLILLYSQFVHTGEPLEKYFSYVQQLSQSNGNYQKGEIEIVVDPEEISHIQKIQKNRLLKKGFSADEATEFSQIGIISEDQYWIWLRDAVYFPQKVAGTYDRLIWKSELEKNFPGVAVLPILSSNRIVLLLNYRHATRSWELELPRGGIEFQETLEEAAFRELREETGFLASSVTFLGEMAVDSGVQSSIIPIFMGTVSAQAESSPEYSEAIAGVISFTKEEIKQGLVKGYLEISSQGEKKQVPLRDPFLSFALLQLEYRKLL